MSLLAFALALCAPLSCFAATGTTGQDLLLGCRTAAEGRALDFQAGLCLGTIVTVLNLTQPDRRAERVRRLQGPRRVGEPGAQGRAALHGGEPPGAEEGARRHRRERHAARLALPEEEGAALVTH